MVEERLECFGEFQRETRQTLSLLSTRVQQLCEEMENMVVRVEGSYDALSSGITENRKQLAMLMQEIHSRKRTAPVLLSAPSTKPVTLTGNFSGHTGPIWCLTLSPDERLLISGSADTTVKVWEVESRKCRFTLEGHQDIVHGVGINGAHIVSGSDRNIKVWDIHSGKCLRTFDAHDNTVCSLVCRAGYIFSGSFSEIKVWDRHYSGIHTLRGHNHWVRAICVWNNLLFTGSYNRILVYDINDNFQCKATVTENCGSIYSIAVGNGKLMAGTYENLIYVWDVETLHSPNILHGHTGAVYSLAVRDSKCFSGSYDTTVRVWNLDTMQCLQTLSEHSSSVEAVISATYSSTIFTGAGDALIHMWNH
eukprot:TRINITY_DN6413_c0_g1_i2.p1 TRINITY_DN6413_c0_g1~~TRINITY_DN6413_c0_g1_i2.p1  ORF type:complete len:364 (-),score=79.90 TRINITY_DN6413_c0_g1_i2:27-1118(-)